MSRAAMEEVSPGDAGFDLVALLIEAFREVQMAALPDDRAELSGQHVGAALAAGSVFAGIQLGIMIGLGFEEDRPITIKRLLKVVEANFRQGVALGKAQIVDAAGGLQ